MQAPVGLRARKRERTHQAISATAIALFLERGFDEVSVAEIAAAAEVSKPTLFKYFASKEDLVLHRIADHQGEAARVVRERAHGETPLAALHRHFLDGLRDRNPVTGLNDHPEVLAYHRMIFETSSLLTRVTRYAEDDEQALGAALAEPTALGDDLVARLLAAQVIPVQRVLARRNWRRLVDGESAATAYPGAVDAADRAFRMLHAGLDARN